MSREPELQADGSYRITGALRLELGPAPAFDIQDVPAGVFVIHRAVPATIEGAQMVREIARIDADGRVTIAEGVTAEDIVRAVASIAAK